MQKEDIKSHLNRALDSLFAIDAHLLDVNSSERSITHRLAVHLTNQIPSYDIDCEYNRDGFDVKRLQLEHRDTTDIDENAVTVFPDIVVHKRGNNDFNLLVIELKKVSSSVSNTYDLRKLKAFHDELHYTYAVHIVLGKVNKNKILEITWICE